MFSDPDEIVDVKGTIVQADSVEGRQDLSAIGIKFDENQVPLSYKIRINDYLSTTRKKMLDSASTNAEKPFDPVGAGKYKAAAEAKATNAAANQPAQANANQAGASAQAATTGATPAPTAEAATAKPAETATQAASPEAATMQNPQPAVSTEAKPEAATPAQPTETQAPTA